jgi:hypothetical protein
LLQPNAMKRMASRNSCFHPRLQGALYIFLFFGCAACAGVGATVTFIDPTRPRAVGATAMIAASAIGIATARHWRRVLPAVFLCGALNGLIILAEGHALNSPGIPVPRLLGVLLTLGMIAGAVLTAAANRRQFSSVERLSFSGIFLCFALLFSSFDVQSAAVAGALCCASIPLFSGFLAHRSRTSRV